MQFITEDPIPFPPDPIHHSPTRSKNTPTNNTHNDDDNNNNNEQLVSPVTTVSNTQPMHPQTETTPHSHHSDHHISQSIATIPQTNQANSTTATKPKSSAEAPIISLSIDDDVKSDSDCKQLRNSANCHQSHDHLNKEYRVKLYELTDDGNWHDEGTGCIHFELSKDSNHKTIQITIMSEPVKDEKSILLLEHTATNQILYDKQGESIIQWLDSSDSVHDKSRHGQIERAISFQHKTKCTELWNLIGCIKAHGTNEENKSNAKPHKSDNIHFDSDDDDICMNEKNSNDSNELLTTFLSDCNDDETPINAPNGQQEHSDDDIDINIDENIVKTEPNHNLNRKKSKKKSYFEKNNDDRISTKKEKDAADDTQTTDTSSDEDDGGTQFLQKLTMRTQKKAKKKKLEIPVPTQLNLCEVYSKVKLAVESKDMSALTTMASKPWRAALYKVFLALEQQQIQRINDLNITHKHAISPPPITIDINSTAKAASPSPSPSPLPKLEKVRSPSVTPRLSTASLTSLPPSVDEDTRSYHPLEFVFMIVLECCRESTGIKLKKKEDGNTSRLKSKFDAIAQQQLGYIMHTSLAQLLNGSFGHSPQRNSTQLMMVYLGKEFISKCIAMLEYDPIRRINACGCDGGGGGGIALSYKHRNFLKLARVEKLKEIELMDGEELYEEIEYVYKLNYVRDCVLLGKLDLEQQCFHIINHQIARYNSLICETIAEDTAFLHCLFNKIKQSCSTHYGIIPLTQLNSVKAIVQKSPTLPLTPTNEENDMDAMLPLRNISRTVSIDDTSDNVTNTAANGENKAVLNGHITDDNDDNMQDDNSNIEEEKDILYQDDEYFQAMHRRQENRRELFSAPDGVLFRFLSEFLTRTKSITDPQSRSAIFTELIAAGLLDTLSVCVSAYHVLPTREFSHIWLILVECVHHMLSGAPCSNQAQVRAFVVGQIEAFNGCTEDIQQKPRTLLQRLCAVFSPAYICENDAILDQIYYVITDVLGLGDLMVDGGAGSLSYVGLSADRDSRSKHLKIISVHFFDECVPLFYNILSASQRYMSYNNSSGDSDDIAPYSQIKRMQKLVINLLAACCEQEQFIAKLKQVEETHKLMSCVHDLIHVPKANEGTLGNKDLSMCSIRFLRQCLHLAQHDRFWSGRIKTYGLFKNVLAVFERNGLEKYNMLNSTVLSVFASIEDKKIEDIIMYLGEEKILEKYNKLIAYTSKFADLIELYEKAQHGIPIQQTIDDQSTATLSNCDSLSPRMSPNGLSPGMLGSNAWQNQASKEEIHYFDHEEEGADYALDDGDNSNNNNGEDINNNHKHKHNEHKREEDEDIDMNSNDTPIKMRHNGHGHMHGILYKDSPRPGTGAFGAGLVAVRKGKELRLPDRQKNNEDSYDLLGNARKMKNKRNGGMGFSFGIKKEKETSPFLDFVSNAMSDSDTKLRKDKIKSTHNKKRKFEEISVTTTSNYVDKTAEMEHDDPPKKKQKLMRNGDVNESPDTFDMNEEENDDIDLNKDRHHNHNYNGNGSILIKGDSIGMEKHQKHSKDKDKDKHVHFDANEKNTNVNNNELNNCNTNKKKQLNEYMLHSNDINMTDNRTDNLSPSITAK